MNSGIAIGIVIGLIAGLVLGVFIGVLVISPSGLLPINAGTGTNNQVKVSGTVPNKASGTIYFANLDETLKTSASIANGKYSVLLVGGQSYTAYSEDRTYPTTYNYITYNDFYVPSGVSTFTENLVSKYG
jgi:hypothetical protein